MPRELRPETPICAHGRDNTWLPNEPATTPAPCHRPLATCGVVGTRRSSKRSNTALAGNITSERTNSAPFANPAPHTYAARAAATAGGRWRPTAAAAAAAGYGRRRPRRARARALTGAKHAASIVATVVHP